MVSPVDDEDSCEVFGLIKKLDIATGNKKKPKPSCKMWTFNVKYNRIFLILLCQ